MTETLTPQTKIRSNTIYRIEHEITGTINVANVHDVTFEGGTLIGGYNLTGVNNGITWADQEIQATNIGVQIRSDGSKIEFYNCDLHGGNYGTWIRPASGGYVSGLLFDGCQVHSTRDDSVYVYKAHRFTFKNGLIHHSNLNWKAPETSQKVAAGDGMQLILCDRVSIEGNTIDRSHTGNKFCIIFSGSAGSNNTPKVPDNFIQINNNTFIQPIKTNQGGAGLYFGDLPSDLITEFTFNELTGDMAGIKYTCLGTFYSNGNTYRNNSIGIEVQKTEAKGKSVSDNFVNCLHKTSNNVIVEP
ncbi:MAG: hypothetical protein IPN08_09575 [Bacteroidales bacterium]|nr:hypothetical protein [Bacteroidales bacterium]